MPFMRGMEDPRYRSGSHAAAFSEASPAPFDSFAKISK